MRTLSFSLSISLLVTLCVLAAPAPVFAQAAAPIEPVECWFEVPAGEVIDCGYLTVPADHAAPLGPTLRLAVAVVHSHSAAPAPDPVVYLNGGPGAATVVGVPAMLRALPFDLLLETRDLVVFDQRGTGFSQPALDCPAFGPGLVAANAETALGQDETVALALGLLRQCRADLVAAGADLNLFNSAQSAADVEALRLALGAPAWNLLGISYGTRLGLTVLRDYPHSVRSAVLDSVFPPEADLYTGVTANMGRALGKLYTDCASEVVCRLAYPRLEQVFDAAVARLEAAPAALTLVPAGTGEMVQARLTGGLLASALYQMLYSTAGISAAPAAIYDAYEGDYAAVTTVLAQSGYPAGLPWIAVGQALAVQCSEEAPFVSTAAVGEAQNAAGEALKSLGQFSLLTGVVAHELCAEWVALPAGAHENERVTADAPVLLLAGAYDPVTPPAWAQSAAAGLAHGYYFEVPGVGHGALAGGACPVGLLLAFINEPGHAPDASCLGRMDATPSFRLRAQSARGPVLVVLPVLAALAGWAGWRALAYRRLPNTVRVSARLVAWLPAAAGAGLVALVLAAGDRTDGGPFAPARIVEALIPLIAGMQAAFLFSPDDEPGLEVLLACPRPLAWTLLERLAVLLAGQGLVALLGSLAAAALLDTPVLEGLARVLPPMLFLSAVAVCLTLASRQAVFSVSLTLLLWFGMLWSGDAGGGGLLARWPYLWWLHVFLQPGHVFYWLNRALVMLIGANLVALAAMYLLRDEERVLLGGRSAPRLARKGEA